MPTVTALVMTKNEKEMLPLCLKRLAWADEMLVVDSGSDDGTPELAREAGARVLHHEFEGFAEQTNWGLSQATGDWVVQIDADELMSARLRDSILSVVASNPPEDIFALKRDSYVFGYRMKASSWSGEWVPRLFRKGNVTFTGKVHQDPQVGGRLVGRLEGVLVHYTYRSTAKYFEKFDLYSTLWAQKAWGQGRRTGIGWAFVSSVWRVFHNYFLRGEMFDGRMGVALSLLAGAHTFIRHMKLWGMQNAEKFARTHEKDVDNA
ncbi:MAG: glycosyltransferase family 2 protein [Planctomycetota bacterium]|jgi:glycosyltransferase involved in cell wall biosynthesis|nr:glycosyltransferase family 2 protein [Planctomycetota bacterium]